MKKLTLLALCVMLMPALAVAQPTQEGNPIFHGSYIFPDHPAVTWGSTIEVIAGEVWVDWLLGINHPMGTTCAATDTFCFSVTQTLSWSIPYWPTGNHILDSGAGNWYEYLDFEVYVPCDAEVGQANVVTFVHAYANDEGCFPAILSCSDNPTHRQRGTLTFVVVESPPALYILQDSLYFVGQGQTAAYVPFAICNGDPCAPPTLINYLITSTGTVGAPISQDGSETVDGGDCATVFAIIDAGAAAVCAYDELTIVVWAGDPAVYDTCVQWIHVIEPVAVPMFSAPVVTILVLAMILAAAVILRRRAVSRA